MSKEWNSMVMDEFMKIAIESGLISTKLKPDNKDFVGNPSKNTPLKRRYEPTKEYDVIKNKDVVQLSHPKKVQVADARNEGGVVENLNEQQEKDIEVATKMPTGVINAKLINELIKLAIHLDNNGKYLEAARVDETIERFLYLPFDNNYLYKKAWLNLALTIAGMVAPSVINWFRTQKGATPGAPRTMKYQGGKLVGKVGGIASLITTGIGILGMLGNKITSISEGIREDTQDLLDVLKKAESNNITKALEILEPITNGLLESDLSSQEGMNKFSNAVKKAKVILPQIKRYVLAYTKIENPSLTLVGIGDRIEEKLNDFEESLKNAEKTLADIHNVGNKANDYANEALRETENVQVPEGGDETVAKMQNILFNRGFNGNKWSGEITGKMDSNTIEAIKELEQKLDESLKQFAESKGVSGTFVGQILKDNKIAMDPDNISRIISLTEKQLNK